MLKNINKLEDTRELAKEISDKSENGDIIFLVGDLGTGKTQFTKFFAIARNLDATSPSFGIVNIYGNITHMDLYRLKNYEEALNIGIEEILEDDTIKIIEWPEILEGEDYDLKLTFSFDGRERTVNIEGKGY